jgi:hypothetical protein
MRMRTRRPDGPTMIGVVLVLLGVVWLAGRIINVDLSQVPWPLYIIVLGVAILVLSLPARDRGGEGLAVLGAIVTMTGLVLLYQTITNHWESWAYAWTLIAPGSVGVGLLVFGLFAGRPRLVAAGARTALTGLGLFLAGAVFFELILNIGGDHFGQTGRIALAAVLIAAGLLWLALNLRPQRR